VDNATVQSLLDQANAAQSTAMADKSTAATLPGMLTDALNKKFGESNPLIQARDTAMTNYLTAGTGAEKKYLPENQGGTIYSPTERRSLISQDEANASVPLFSIQDLISRAYGGIGNVVKSASDAYNAQVQNELDKATLARQSYQDAYKQYSDEQQLALQYASLRASMANAAASRASSGPTKSQVIDAIRNDVSAGSSKGNAAYNPNLLHDIFAKYSGYANPDEILAIYNASSKFGPAVVRPGMPGDESSFLINTGVSENSINYANAQKVSSLVQQAKNAGKPANQIKQVIQTYGFNPSQFGY